jgi:hypothetical protein
LSLVVTQLALKVAEGLPLARPDLQRILLDPTIGGVLDW